MSEDLTGKRLGHYSIDGVLGKGGMSVMYRATDVRLGRKVALKVIAGHLSADAEFRERFVDEARNTSAIDHSNVVPLYDFGEADGLLYIAMRMVDGADLAKLIKDGPLAPDRAIGLLGQAAAALDMLHERGLVHLDIKPANVLVTAKESANEHIYLADFGLTRRGATGHRTRTGDFLGSPMYAAPEHLRGEPVDGRTDLYALACVLYACLTGRAPFRGQVPDVISGHLGPNIPTVTSVVELPAEIDGVLAKGMAKRADDRFGTCQELVEAAKQALAGVANRNVPPKLRRAGTGAAAAPRVAELPGDTAAGGAAPEAAAEHPHSAQPTQPVQPPPARPAQPPVQQPVQPAQPVQPSAESPTAPGRAPVPPPQQYPPQFPPPMQPVAQQPPYPQQYPAPQQFGGQQQGFHPQQDPVRLRDPVPVNTGAFGARPGEGAHPAPPAKRRWVVPVIVGAVVVIIAVVLIIVFTRQGGSGSGGVTVPTGETTNTQQAPPTKLPHIKPG